MRGVAGWRRHLPGTARGLPVCVPPRSKGPGIWRSSKATTRRRRCSMTRPWHSSARSAIRRVSPARSPTWELWQIDRATTAARRHCSRRLSRWLGSEETRCKSPGPWATWLQCGTARANTRGAALYREALALFEGLGDRKGVATALDNLGLVALRQGEYERAAVWLEKSLALARELGDRHGIVVSLISLADVAERQGAHGRSTVLLREGLQLARDIGAGDEVAESLEGLAWVAIGQGHPPVQRAWAVPPRHGGWRSACPWRVRRVAIMTGRCRACGQPWVRRRSPLRGPKGGHCRWSKPRRWR